jgi:BlaI family penicillinase repressor
MYARSEITEAQLEVMSVLWAKNGGTAAEVLEALSDARDVDRARTTVSTLLRRLEAKRWVRADPQYGGGVRYVPRIRIEDARGRAIFRIEQHFYHGSRTAMLADLLRTRCSPIVLRRLRQVIDHRLGSLVGGERRSIQG